MRAALTLVLLALMAEPGPLTGQESQVLGRQVELRLRTGHARARGELLAVRPDSVWLMSGGSIVALDLTAIERATVQRHGMTGRKGLLFGLAVGVVSGIGLTIACGNADAESCGGVMAGSTLFGALLGGLAGLSFSSSSQWRFQPPLADSLSRFARFPQGLPPGVLLTLTGAGSDTTRRP